VARPPTKIIFPFLPVGKVNGKSGSHVTLLVTGAAGSLEPFVESCGTKKYPGHLGRSPSALRKSARSIAAWRLAKSSTAAHLFDWLAASKPALSGSLHLGACTDTRELDVAYLTRVEFGIHTSYLALRDEHGLPLVYASSCRDVRRRCAWVR